jgi:hypothetical protein
LELIGVEGAEGEAEVRALVLTALDEAGLGRHRVGLGDGALYRTLLEGLFEGGSETLLSDLKKRFVARLQEVKDALYRDMVSRKWFVKRPDKVRAMWTGIGVAALLLGIGATVALAYFTKLGLLGLPLVVGGILVMIGAKRMPRRTAKGTAMTRRVNGFRVVIEKGRGAHVPLGRGGEDLHAVPAVRRRVRRDGELGEGVRGARTGAV